MLLLCDNCKLSILFFICMFTQSPQLLGKLVVEKLGTYQFYMQQNLVQYYNMSNFTEFGFGTDTQT